MTQRAKSILFYLLTTAICSYILLNPYQSVYYSKKALNMCANSIIPSLFTFIVLSKIISGYTCSYSHFSKKSLFAKLLCLPDVLIPTCVCGLFFGAPSGAVAVCDIYKSGLCTKKQAEAAVVLCNNCSAAFIMSIVAAVLQNTRLALLLLISNILTTLTVYFLLFRSRQVYSEKMLYTQINKKTTLSELICTSVKDSAHSTVTLCGYIILFFTFSAIIQDKISVILQNSFSENTLLNIRALISLFFEMSSGALSCSYAAGNIKIVLCSVCVAFCGLSVIFQVTSIMNQAELSPKNYILAKFVSALLCPIFMLLFIFLIPEKAICVSNFSPVYHKGISSKALITAVFILLIFSIGVRVLSFIDKSNKKNL